MKRIFPAVVAVSIIIICGCRSTKPDEYKLYYLGGQSNMDGYGYVSDLTKELKKPMEDVYIFQGNCSPDNTTLDGRGIWSELMPGHGTGFTSDGLKNYYSDRFGVELTFAAELQLLDPDSKIAIIKYSLGGTSIDEEAAGNSGSWDPQYMDGEGINQYDNFLATISRAFSVRDINGDGRDDRLIPSGIIWMQGESDGAFTEEIALRYYDNLTELMSLMRDAFGADIPVVLGRISDSGMSDSGLVWEWGDIIREAQHKFADNDCCSAIVTSTDTYGYSDPWHYKSEGYLDLGRQFARKVRDIEYRTLNAERSTLFFPGFSRGTGFPGH